MGILMATLKVTEDGAFNWLREVSQGIHRKLRDVADDVMLPGGLPTR
jgi:AmiR/NasT family two-component response regulator